MNYKNFTDLQDDIRRYNSTSILEVGSKICWKLWEDGYLNPDHWLNVDANRNYAIRLMLLASGGNPHRQKNISYKEFIDLINVYHNLTLRTISDQNILDQEAQSISDSIKKWENKNEQDVRNFVLKLSDVLDLKLIREHTNLLFSQRIKAFQNAGLGDKLARINRTIKLIDLLDKDCNKDFTDNFSNIFSNYTQLSPINYFRQYQVCLGLFRRQKGFLNFNQMPTIDSEVLNLGITPENIKIFVEQNSLPFTTTTEKNDSFRSMVNNSLKSVSDFYRPFFYNQFLETPLIKLEHENFCLPDPISLTESCWNQVKNVILKSKENDEKKAGHLLGKLFETYLETIPLPVISPESNSFCKIKEENHRKRADFLIKTSSAYILLECKNSVMSADTSSYFQADKLGNLWSRIHIGVEQISATAKDLNLKDKPVIPVVITFYDSIAAAEVFQEMIKKTDYCSRLGLDMPPIVYSLHQFEHWLSDRSLNNWVELILAQQKGSCVPADNKGHNYKHLDNETQRWMIET